MRALWLARSQGAERMLRKAAASSLEHHSVLQIRSLRCCVLVFHAADTASLAT